MQPTEACDIGDALDDRPVPAVWPRPIHVGNEKYLDGFWIIEASDPSTWRSSSPPRGAYGRRRCPAMASNESDSPQPAFQKVLKDIREAVSDRGRGVRGRGERPPAGGARTTGDDLRCSTWFP